MIEKDSVLNSIIEGVLEDLEVRRVPLSDLNRALAEAGDLRGARAALSGDEMKIISEVKRASPSKGDLGAIENPAHLASEYESGGASVVSVLTEGRRFKGSLLDFDAVRKSISLPMLRKDFIVTEYQVIESRVVGADLLLLIVAGLSRAEYLDFHQMARELGMDVLVEVHTEDELEQALEAKPEIIGVNARNLKTLEVDSIAFRRILPLIPAGIIKVAESGISDRSEVIEVEELGANAILVGETLVRAGDPKGAISRLLGR